jgi:hypothetical protein
MVVANLPCEIVDNTISGQEEAVCSPEEEPCEQMQASVTQELPVSAEDEQNQNCSSFEQHEAPLE